MAILESEIEYTNTITISKEEYDALKTDAVKLDILLEALCKKASLVAYFDDALHFSQIDETIYILFPELCGNLVQRLKEEERERLREEQDDD